MILALGLSVAAASAYGALAALAAGERVNATRAALGLAWLFHGLTLANGLFGSVSSFGFAPALSMTAWLVLTVYAIESRLYPQIDARWTLALLGAGSVLLALVYPGTPHRAGLSPWLPLHWALGIASYGLMASAAIHAWLLVRAERQMRGGAMATGAGLPVLKLERLMFRFAQSGFALLSGTLVAGFWFGLHGGGLRWDHKTIFSLLAWLTLAVLLLGRAGFGWRGRRAARLVQIGALLLLLAYVGSRFVLEVVLGKA